MRLQKLISERGVASRRQAEEMIRAGRVLVNGQVAALGQSADPAADEILIDGKILPKKELSAKYIMLNKPRGYVCTLSDERGRKTVAELVRDCGRRVYPVGRLDMDSEGLLMLTDDGAFAQRMMHPSHQVSKVYRVTVTGYTERGMQRLSEPMELDGYRLRQPGLRLLETGEKTRLEITIHEGRNRQVRRMCALAGMEVIRLQRIREGSLCLGNLPLGKWRELTPPEIGSLMGDAT